MKQEKKPRSDFLVDEDWWTVWFGLFFILIATIYGLLYLSDAVPKMPKPKMSTWVTSPWDAFVSPAKKQFKIKKNMTVAEFAEKINRWGKGAKAEIIPIPVAINKPADPIIKETEGLDEPDPIMTPPSKYMLKVYSTRDGPGKTISLKLTLKPGQKFTFRAKEKDEHGLGAKTYTSQIIDSPNSTIGAGLCVIKAQRKTNVLIPVILALLAIGLVCGVGVKVMSSESYKKFLMAYGFIALLSFVSLFIAYQKTIKAYGISYAAWALAFGLLISNTIGTPKWIMKGVKTEMYIKAGLVLLGAEILFGKILKLGVPGLMVAWIVTPTVVTFMYLFGVKYLKMVSKPLVMIIAMATSVCGVSAAIAAAGATRAKKEELTLAVGMTLIFTVLMMIFMPLAIKLMITHGWLGMTDVLGGAWIGGVVDSTGAVVAAGAMLGADAETVAAVVKMVQNVLIGVIGFIIAVIWVAKVDRDPNAPRPSPKEIWIRFPKFIVGFVLASLIFSFVLVPLFGKLFGGQAAAMTSGLNLVEKNVIKAVTNPLRGLFFCLAFVSIGLESNFRDLASQLVGGKPIILYVIGQSFNLILTLFIAWLAFIKFFPNAIG